MWPITSYYLLLHWYIRLAGLNETLVDACHKHQVPYPELNDCLIAFAEPLEHFRQLCHVGKVEVEEVKSRKVGIVFRNLFHDLKGFCPKAFAKALVDFLWF